MKMLTLNTHSLIEPEYEQKLVYFLELIEKEQPDVFALQEVNQDASEEIVPDQDLSGFHRCDEFIIPVRRGNHALRLSELLRAKGLAYEWIWVSAKLGYDKYDEGLALFSKTPIIAQEQFLISKSDSYQYWKTRRVVGIQVQGLENCWFYTVHMGWWEDEEEPFSQQWHRLQERLVKPIKQKKLIWLMGDFNSPASTPGQGYSMICEDGWYDSYKLALQKDDGVTVEEIIDGWRDKTEELENSKESSHGMRLDYLFCNQCIPVTSSQVICNGKNYPVVSDHYGVMIEAADRLPDNEDK